VTIDGVWIGEWVYWTHAHYSEPQVITTPLLMSVLHTSLQQHLSCFQIAVSSPAVPLQRLLTVEILQLLALTSYLYSLPCRTAYELTTYSTPRLAAISCQPHNLLFIGWLSTNNYQMTGSLQLSSLQPLCTHRVENTVSNGNSEACLLHRCITTVAVSLRGRCLTNSVSVRYTIYVTSNMYICFANHSGQGTSDKYELMSV
jgi:hypothetical protein